MNVLDRIKIIVKWIIGAGYANNQKEVGELLGYTNESSFSQILNGKKTLPNTFIDRLLAIDNNLSKDWLLTGEGGMLKKEYNSIVSEPTVSYGEIESEGGVTAISIIDRNSRSIEKMVEIADRNSRSIQQLVDSNMKLIELLHQNGIIISDETRKGGFYDSKEDKEGQSRNTRTTQAG